MEPAMVNETEHSHAGHHGHSLEQMKMESEIATRLLQLDDQERQGYYGEAYNQIFATALASRGDEAVDQTFGADAYMIGHLQGHSAPAQRVLEVGCGCGYLSLELAKLGRVVTGIDVSSVAIDAAKDHAGRLPADAMVSFEVMNATQMAFPDSSFSMVYSVEVLEHLHERDVVPHLREVARVLKPGGVYWLMTPNRLQGLSVGDRFGLHDHHHGDDETADVHLKEWTYTELAPLLRQAGFGALRSPWRVRTLQFLPSLPIVVKTFGEWLAPRLPARLRGLGLQAFGCMHCTLSARLREA
jgi:2-polyprenyl-3-methyl-5-hydroxy-6-metoxy-1,4-benzoquinol methylase